MAVSPDTPVEDVPTPDEIKVLFEPFKLGRYDLSTRVVYAPLTRCRAINTVPVDFTAQYYAERAHKGQFMLTEATLVAANGHGYPNTPGIYTDEQKAAWKPIVEAVKDKGAIFFCQIWHCGRASHSVYNADGSLPVAPSATPVSDGTKVYNPNTFEELDFETPRALALDEIPQYVEYFRTAAAASLEVGFDGVEIHGGNGYLIDQFLKTSVNERTDEYGGSIENRARFLFEVVDAVVAEVGADRVGLRLTAYGNFLDAHDEDPHALFNYVCAEVSKRGIAYVHIIESRVNGNADREAGEAETLDGFREAARPVPFIAAGGFRRDGAAKKISDDKADLIAMGRWALANPDLLLRWKLGAPLNQYDRATFYVPGEAGYIDYPFLKDTPEGEAFFSAE